MSDLEKRFHEEWLGMVQPEGLVVAVPVLVDAQCMKRLEPALQQKLLDICPPATSTETAPRARRSTSRLAAVPNEGRAIRDLGAFLSDVLDLTPELFDTGTTLPQDLCLYVPEGQQTVRPTLALRNPDAPASGSDTAENDWSSRYLLLVWDLAAHDGGEALDLDRPEVVTGPWRYPAAAKFDRLLRHLRVPVGIITNRRIVRLVYAPHGESSGSITFRIDDMASVGGRPILDAFVMLLSAFRLLGDAPEHRLHGLLADSRTRQATVTNELAQQVFEALEILLAGFEAAAERDRSELLDDALKRDDDHLYGGLLAVLLRLVFLLYAEDRGLMPLEDDFYAKNVSVLGLFQRLQEDHGRFPDSMSRRFGAWGQLVTLFRAIFRGVEHGSLKLPPRRGELFDPHRFPFLEGWGPGGSAPIDRPEEQTQVRVPTVDDGTVYRVLQRLVMFQGQRLSYDTLDVEQIGSVYEALMGYHVHRVYSPAVCLRPDRVWVTAQELLEQPKNQRAKWLQEHANVPKQQVDKLAKQVNELKADDDDGVTALLETLKVKNTDRVAAGRLVVQPGAERRRTSSHYTPRSLSAPIVRRTLEPLLAALGEKPTASQILELKVCDPAMGSGAFLVEACRFLADQVVVAWTREGKIEELARDHEDVVHHARRVVAQRCLYGVDKNQFAVSLAKLSLWLVTLAKELPFTFLDHALRHGDSLIGLTLDQIRAFHWKPGAVTNDFPLFRDEIAASLDQALTLRQEIIKLAVDPSPKAQREKEHLLWEAEDALDRVRLIADLCVGAFFAGESERQRNVERERRLRAVTSWLGSDEPPPPELMALRQELRKRITPLHWMVEYPEVFYDERPDPLEQGRVNGAAWMDAFVGNPPFAGKNQVTETNGAGYIDWLLTTIEGAHGNADYSAYFFRRTATLLGAHGTIGLLATKTISQGDTRETGLQPLVRDRGFVVYEATRSRPWPGDAAVSVAIVHLALGAPSKAEPCRRLDGESVQNINSRLEPKPERPDPLPLGANTGLSFGGSFVLGNGFTLTPQERDDLLAEDPNSGSVIRPYLGGKELNESPNHANERFIIDFGDRPEGDARRYRLAFERVEREVRPLRESASVKQRDRRELWWMFATRVPDVDAYFASYARCLAASQVSKHLAFAFLPRGITFANTLVLFLLDSYAAFGVLQSRVHEVWARRISSSLEDRLRYAASDCFETYPFPTSTPRALPADLEAPSKAVYEARARFMRDTEQGLTKTYNALKDPVVTDSRVVELRRLHEALDRAVLAAYGWSQIPVPSYVVPATDAERRALEAFDDAVIDRLFELNAKRAAEERAAVPTELPKTRKSTGRRKTMTPVALTSAALRPFFPAEEVGTHHDIILDRIKERFGTIDEFCRLAGVERSAVTEVLSKEAEPSFESFRVVTDSLGVGSEVVILRKMDGVIIRELDELTKRLDVLRRTPAKKKRAAATKTRELFETGLSRVLKGLESLDDAEFATAASERFEQAIKTLVEVQQGVRAKIARAIDTPSVPKDAPHAEMP